MKILPFNKFNESVESNLSKGFYKSGVAIEYLYKQKAFEKEKFTDFDIKVINDSLNYFNHINGYSYKSYFKDNNSLIIEINIPNNQCAKFIFEKHLDSWFVLINEGDVRMPKNIIFYVSDGINDAINLIKNMI